jgi:hypothetical protein
MRRTWLPGRDNVARRYLIHVAGHSLGLLMRSLFGAGTPRAAAYLRLLWLAVGDRLLLVLLALQMTGTNTASAAIAIITVMLGSRMGLQQVPKSMDVWRNAGWRRVSRRRLNKLSCAGWLPHDRGFVPGLPRSKDERRPAAGS